MAVDAQDTEKTSAVDAAVNSDHSDSAPAEEKGETRPLHGIKWVLAVLAILSSTFLFALDTTVVCSRMIIIGINRSPNSVSASR